MTLPIVTVVRTNENHSVISHDVTVAYFLPAEHQVQPPQPADSEIFIEIWPATTVYTRLGVLKYNSGSPCHGHPWRYVTLAVAAAMPTAKCYAGNTWSLNVVGYFCLKKMFATFSLYSPFTGPTNEVTIINQINTMAELLDSPGVCINDSFIVAGYTNPAHSNRLNEIWFLERP